MTYQTAIIIPARLGSTRFPNKPLADINGKPMIVHVLERAQQAKIGDVWVACCEREVFDVVTSHGGKAVMTEADLPSGTDRIYQAMQQIGESYDVIINVQGDLPTIEPQVICRALEVLEESHADISTLAAVITEEAEKNNPNVVKAIIANNQNDKGGRALYFTRATAPYGPGALFHHIGLYAYRKEALEKFVSLSPSLLEQREKLEQLRALENGLHIEVGVVDTVPLGVDTPEDLEKIKTLVY